MSRKYSSSLLFLVAFVALLVAIHLPYLNLPYFWDEMGQFAPASMDLYHDGSWVTHSATPNVHPPAVMAVVALAWRVFGYSIPVARMAMLFVAAVGAWLSFLLAIRLSRGSVGAPAFAAVLFLLATPLFYTQSMLVMLDMPAMTCTVLALLLFLDRRYALCAAACTLLVLVKETSITTPMVFAAWLWFREKKLREGLYFIAPAGALAIWLIVLHHVTGHWLGNQQFAEENLGGALEFHHLLFAFLGRVWFLFIADGRWIGAIALIAGWRLLRGNEWAIAARVGVAQIVIVTLLGSAELNRYLLPALPILYAAIATAASGYPVNWQWISHASLIALLFLGWFWNPPYPYPYEDNLTMVDFVRLQQDAAAFLEVYAPTKRIASVWPFSSAIQNPELGYVEQPLHAMEIRSLYLADLANLDRRNFDVLVTYKRITPIKDTWLDVAPLRWLLRRLRRYYDPRVQATDEEIRSRLGFVSVMRWTRRDQWIEIYAPAAGPLIHSPLLQ